jgi:hypothetical protein
VSVAIATQSLRISSSRPEAIVCHRKLQHGALKEIAAEEAFASSAQMNKAPSTIL